MNVHTKRTIRNFLIGLAVYTVVGIVFGYMFDVAPYIAALGWFAIDAATDVKDEVVRSIRRHDRRTAMRRKYAPRATTPIVPDAFTPSPRMGGVIDLRESDESPDEWLQRNYPHITDTDGNR